jgi:hydroxyacylglutathione hydrolase
MTNDQVILEQIPVGAYKNFSYIVGSNRSHKAVLFDPAYEVQSLSSRLTQLGLKLEVIINTHAHFDHIEGNQKLKQLTGAKVIMHNSSLALKDRGVSDGEELEIGDDVTLRFIHTPGHSPESMCIQVNDYGLITGDTLFMGECGRVDLPGGDANLLYDSFEKLRRLNLDLIVYPGHDYGKTKSSTLREQVESNYTMAKRTRQEFLKFMNEP